MLARYHVVMPTHYKTRVFVIHAIYADTVSAYAGSIDVRPKHRMRDWLHINKHEQKQRRTGGRKTQLTYVSADID